MRTIATDDNSPYAATLDLTGYTGQHVIRAVVWSSNSSTFESENIGSAGTVVTLPGSIALVAPASGATLAGTVTVTGSVSGVVTSLDAILGTSDYVASLSAPGFSSTFASDWYEDGTTTLRLEDGSGYGLSSPTIGVTLKNTFAAMTAPANNATIAAPTILSASASADGLEFVEQVRFLVDGVEVGTDWYPPYQVSWNPTGVPNGAHTVRAEAVITDGRAVLSSARTVNLKVGLVTRLAGATRYETAVAISAASFAPNVPVAYIATGLSFPDALAGAAVAGRDGGPVLLVPGTTIPTAIANELTRLRPGRIVVLGGSSVVSDGVKAALQGYTSGLVTRLAGATRYETAVAISAASFAPNVPVAYIATGLSFPDALAGAAVAGRDGGPVLLVPGTTIPTAIANELTRLRPGRIVVLGGSSVVSDGVKAALQGYTSGLVTRLAGATRYETAVAISAASFAPNVPVAYIATGLSFPDALAGAAVAGRDGGPVLLVPGTTIPTAIANELTRLRPGRIVVLGGSSVVSDGVKAALVSYAKP